MLQGYSYSNELQEQDLTIEKWMVSDINTLTPTSTVKQAARMMEASGAMFIPVVGESHSPLGIMTYKEVIQALLNKNENHLIIHYMGTEDFQIVRLSDSILDIYPLDYSYYLVVDEINQLIGILTQKEIVNGLSTYMEELNRNSHTAEILDIILDSAYEGVAVVDRNGTLVEFNDSYSRFIGVDKKDAIGRPVQEVIDNTNLHHTVKTGMPERGIIQYIQGQPMVVHRIPLWKNNQVVGAIGMLIFEGVTELYRIYDRFQEKVKPHLPNQNKEEPKQKFIPKSGSIENIIGQSEEIANLKRMTRKVAKTGATVLITGESGTGKELFARSIHDLSNRADGPFISVNCGAIPEQLFESELFGYEEGAFTGAKKGGKPGKFEMAQGGTIFLDEIGEMPLIMQTKLLRVLQEKEFERVGGINKQPLDVKIVLATNRDLRKMVEEGNFREDLYYRINVIELEIPPLRKRPIDVPLLISHYLKLLCKEYNIAEKEVTGEAMHILMDYAWYGNIRELANLMEKLVILTDGKTIDVMDLPNYMKNRKMFVSSSPYHQVKLEESNKEKEIIKRTLEETGGNKTKAAEKLGIHRTTLYQKLRKYNL
ncbi:sigma-54-dependent Fis family transcriptional regulator [Oceanobacillus senegalensis]|uniref:sigma-54-dependent Fis family transcriptional regulator n=1 Tax=Oceanobacillus senegalensis TaxID=1936063 RepID=UPI000A3124DA|nr:sigma-54-dependent Fis family transcriptional regulator [Oceanobacillus senegalensis]